MLPFVEDQQVKHVAAIVASRRQLTRLSSSNNHCLISPFHINRTENRPMSKRTRREWLCLVGAGGVAGLAGCNLSGDSSPEEDSPQRTKLTAEMRLRPKQNPISHPVSLSGGPSRLGMLCFHRRQSSMTPSTSEVRTGMWTGSRTSTPHKPVVTTSERPRNQPRTSPPRLSAPSGVAWTYCVARHSRLSSGQ